ncbi:MAG: DNA-3-methyladenine glycosylase 2 family protein, partial [Hydrogenoanaerobacterium sp.]
ELAPLRSGFRAKYIIDAANKVASGEVNLDDVAKQPLEEARKTLQTIIGVGPKVAECALLYGFGRMECFPLDVWMKRAMKELFPAGLPQCANEYAGIAQQYIFNYARLSGKIL